MAGWLEDSQTFEKWTALAEKSEGGEIPAADLADASKALISVFDLINGMGMPANDMKGNANTLQKLADLSPGSTVESLVNKECDGQDDKACKKISLDGKTATCALMWLFRALAFVNKLLEILLAEPSKKLSECVTAGYEVSLKPHHGMIVRGTFSVAVKAAPSRADFIKKLGPDEAAVFSKIGAGLPNMRKLVERGQAFLTSKNATYFKP